MRAERLPYFSFHEGSTRDLRSNVSAFRALGALKGELVLRVLAARRHVLLSDVDVIWLRDPRALLDRALGAADVMVATGCLSPTDDDDERRGPRAPTAVPTAQRTSATPPSTPACSSSAPPRRRRRGGGVAPPLSPRRRTSGSTIRCAILAQFWRNSLTRLWPSHDHSSRSTSSCGMASGCRDGAVKAAVPNGA